MLDAKSSKVAVINRASIDSRAPQAQQQVKLL